MKLMWTLVTGFLYCEVLSVALLLLPFISLKRWKSIFNSRAVSIVSSNASFYFKACIVLLTGFFIESIRNVWIRSAALQELKKHPENLQTETETIFLKRLFKSQRNLYVCALALFLCFVIHRLAKLITELDRLLADQQASSANYGVHPTVSLPRGKQNVYKTRPDNPEDEIATLKGQIELTLEEQKLARDDLQETRRRVSQLSKEYTELVAKQEALKVQLLSLSRASVGR